MEVILKSESFQLSKWAGVAHAALTPDGDQAERLISEAKSVSALGVLWNSVDDTLNLRAVSKLIPALKPTKRTVLSYVAKLFDPAGWVAPVIIAAKIFIQDF